MDSMNLHNMSQNRSFNDSTHDSEGGEVNSILHVVTWIIIAVGIPLILLAIYALHSLVRNGNVSPIYVINLLMSHLIQLCCYIVWETNPDHFQSYVTKCIYMCGLNSSVGFMVCVALERYLVIVFPLWYRFRRTIKTSVLVCVVVWALPAVYITASSFWIPDKTQLTIQFIYFLLPLPLLIFFLVGTLKALSASKSVPDDEKRRIVGTLVLVLLIYMLLFSPNTILTVCDALSIEYHRPLGTVSFMLVMFSPLADMVLYIFMKKGTIDKLLATLCWCRMDSNDNRRPSDSMMATFTQSAP